MTMRVNLTIILSLTTLGLLGACGGEESTTSTSSSSTTTSSSSTTTSTSTGGTGGSGGSTGGTGGSGGLAQGGGGQGGDGGQGGAQAFGITSSAYADMGMIPLEQACSNHGGSNISPPLNWTAGPSGTESYAIVFVDLSNGLTHSAIWDIPKNVLSLPKGVEGVAMPSVPAGAKQCKGYNNKFGYQGPCPPNAHTYQFQLHAVNKSSLNIGTDTNKNTVKTTVENASLATVTLTGTFTPP